MPLGDKKGPNGEGPMTGRKQGYCVGNDHPGYESDMPGRGMGRGAGFARGNGLGFGRGQRYGRGFGRSLGRGFGTNPDYNTDSEQNETFNKEIDQLKAQNEALKKQLNSIEETLKNLKK